MPMTTSSVAGEQKSSVGMIIEYFRDFHVLKETRKEYWGVQIINFLDSMFYFALLSFLTLFLSHELGLSDKDAGWSSTVCFSTVTLLLFVSGMWTDWFGIRKSLAFCLISMFVLRLAAVGIAFLPDLVNP